jgi:sortase A
MLLRSINPFPDDGVFAGLHSQQAIHEVNLNSSLLRFGQRLFLSFGLALLAYAGGSIAYAGIYQRYQSWAFEEQRTTALTTNKAVDLDEAVELHEGQLVGKLQIPQVGISVMVLQGVEEQALLTGAGHVPGTPSPGSTGNVVIAAHRDTFFRKLESILPGNRIQLTTIQRTYEYVVQSTEIVAPEDTRVMESRAISELTLITCYPFYYVGSAPKRFVVHALPLDRYTGSTNARHE